MNTYHELTEAMRKGAAVRPQGFNDYFPSDTSGQLLSCALGAAFEGKEGQPERDVGVLDVRDLFFGRQPEPDNVRCPGANCGFLTNPYVDHLLSIVVHLNDTHHWTREAIADWLDSL